MLAFIAGCVVKSYRFFVIVSQLGEFHSPITFMAVSFAADYAIVIFHSCDIMVSRESSSYASLSCLHVLMSSMVYSECN